MSHNKERGKTPMTKGFEHQSQQGGFSIPKSAASPQHGQKAEKDVVKPKEKRSFEPRPGH